MSAPTTKISRPSISPASAGAVGAIFAAPITDPSNHRAQAASRRLARRARHHRALRHRHARADDAHSRQGHAQRRHRPCAGRRVRHRRPARQGRRLAGHRRHGSGADRRRDAALRLARDAVGGFGEGYGAREGAGRFRVVAIDYGVKRNILRLLADAGCEVVVAPATATRAGDSGAATRRRVSLERSRRSRRNRQIRRAGDPRPAGDARSRPSAFASAIR